MKIVSVVVFAVALVGSWALIRSPGQMSESKHVDLQNDLKRIITEYVQKNAPDSKNMRFEKFWTESTKKDEVQASFDYTFEDSSEGNGPVLVEIGGTALLHKVSEKDGLITWNLDKLNFGEDHVDFQEPLQITAGAGELEHPVARPPEKKEVH